MTEQPRRVHWGNGKGKGGDGIFYTEGEVRYLNG